MPSAPTNLQRPITAAPSAQHAERAEPAGSALREFRVPRPEFRPSAYWFWHSIPDAGEMRNQLADFKRSGVETILIQCRLAFPRELYLSPEFLSAYRAAVEIMGEMGIVAGLYDDYNWNSGQAAGRAVEGHDELRERHLFWAVSETGSGTISEIQAPFSASMGPDVSGWIYEGGSLRFDQFEIVSAVLFGESADRREACDVSDRISLVDREGTCEFSLSGGVPAGSRLLVAVSARCATSRLVNYLLPAGGERFVSAGLEPYAEALSGLMPRPLSFLFYDQPGPAFYTWREKTGALGNSLLYAPLLREAAEAACGRPFGTILLALLMDVGSETARLRSSFFRIYAELINRGFFEPVRRFCHANGLRFTGHEVLPHVGSWALNGGFTSIDPRVTPAVDFFGMDAMRDETAVDANNFEAQLSPKLGDSVARANGRSRTMVEVYTTATRTERRGAGQWELTPALVRAQSIRMHLLGARQIILHALFQTDGTRENEDLFVNPRFDFAPGLNFEPWWPYYRHVANETARLSVFLENLVPETPVALFYSLETAFVEGPRHDHAAAFGTWCEILEESGCGYMILDETSLGRARIEDGLLHASGLAFRAVALPSVTRLSASCLRVLADFAAAGGKVWTTGDVAQTCRPDFADHVALASSAISGLIEALPRRAPVLDASPELRRVCGLDSSGFWRYALFNDSGRPLTATIRGAADLEIWDCLDGSVVSHGEAGTLTLVLEQGDLACLRFRPDPAASAPLHLPATRGRAAIEQLLDEGWVFRTADEAEWQTVSVRSGWQEQGHAAYSGTGIYRCEVRTVAGGRAVLELPGVAAALSVSLDGVPKAESWRPPFRVDLGYVAAGSHVLELHVVNTAANRYYGGTSYAGDLWPDESGLTKPPVLRLFSENQEGDR